MTGADEEGNKDEKKMVCWSTDRIDEDRSKREFKDSEEMVQWRSIKQDEVCWA